MFNATYYPIPNVNNTRDLLSIFQFVSNDLSQGLFFPVIILIIWVVQFVGILAERKPASRAFVTASFSASVLSIMLGITALMQQKWIYLLVIMVSLSAFWIKLASARE